VEGKRRKKKERERERERETPRFSAQLLAAE
jgi:hypothetical protein